MDRDDALDLLVQTACQMPWSNPPAGSLEPVDASDLDEQASVAIDPLFVQADAAIELISRCEALLDRRRKDRHRKTELLDEAKREFDSSRDEMEKFNVTLLNLVGQPQGGQDRFSHAQVRLFLTGHEAAKRGDEALKGIWAATRSVQWLPRSFDSISEDAFPQKVDQYVRSKGAATWQLQKLAPFATKLGRKKLPLE